MKAHPGAVANVPLTNESLVGRDWERVYAWAVFTGPNGRIPTLTGPGVVGKTLRTRKIQADLGSDLEAAIDGLRGTRDPHNLAYAHYLLGFVTQNRGDHAATLAHFAEALALCLDLGDTLWLAQCCERMASMLIALGRPNRAVRLLAAAGAIRHALAAPLPPSEATAVANAFAAARVSLSDAAFAAARAAGGELSPAQMVAEALALTAPTGSGDAIASGTGDTIAPIAAESTTGPGLDLTPREREILGLLAQRLTDAEIAQLLSTGTHTVGSHVGHILRKINAANRREVAAIAVRHALLYTDVLHPVPAYTSEALSRSQGVPSADDGRCLLSSEIASKSEAGAFHADWPRGPSQEPVHQGSGEPMGERASDPMTRDFTETPTRYLDGGRDALAAGLEASGVYLWPATAAALT
jgi:non-specific serine/threonine protein kinase